MPADPKSTEEAVARRLCAWAEYHEANWQLYLSKARELIALMEPDFAALREDRDSHQRLAIREMETNARLLAAMKEHT